MNRRNGFFSNIPPVTKNLIIINVIIWAFMFILFQSHGSGGLYGKIMKYGALHYITAPDFNPAQLLTYMFMHDSHGFTHIFFNMFALWMFGQTLEMVMGAKRFFFFYISAGIGAALIQEAVWAFTWQSSFAEFLAANTRLPVSTVVDQLRGSFPASEWKMITDNFLNNAMLTIGASGAVYAILLGFGMLFPNAPLYLMFIPIPIKAKWMVLGYGVLELFLGIGSAHGLSDGVAHFAHLGGMISGFIMIWYWKKKGDLRNGGYF